MPRGGRCGQSQAHGGRLWTLGLGAGRGGGARVRGRAPRWERGGSSGLSWQPSVAGRRHFPGAGGASSRLPGGLFPPGAPGLRRLGASGGLGAPRFGVVSLRVSSAPGPRRALRGCCGAAAVAARRQRRALARRWSLPPTAPSCSPVW